MNLTLRAILMISMASNKVLSADNQQGRLHLKPHPWFVTGFVDGEGSFHVAIYQDSRMQTGWKIIPEFHVSQRLSSRKVLDELVGFFQCGYVKANHARNPMDKTYVYVVRDRSDLLGKIIPFFERYPLKTEKQNDAAIFTKIVRLMAKGEHRIRAGCERIIKLAYTMNGYGRYRRRPISKVM